MKKSVVITGGNRGIGAATAILAARNGWDVCSGYNRHGAEADDIVRRIGGAGGHQGVNVTAEVAASLDAAAKAQVSPPPPKKGAAPGRRQK